MQGKRTEIFGWAAGQWRGGVGGGSRIPGAFDKEKLISRSGAREVEKLVGHATWSIGGYCDINPGARESRGRTVGEHGQDCGICQLRGVIHVAEDCRMYTWSETVPPPPPPPPPGSLLSWKLGLQCGSVEGWNLLERGVWWWKAMCPGFHPGKW